MNTQVVDILISIREDGFTSQRNLAEHSGYSLGMVNKAVQELKKVGYLNEDSYITRKGSLFLERHIPKRAIILAAGVGMRMVPINMECPKGLLEVHGEVLIERLIRQLQEMEITDISVVVGFLKERYEYLIDRFQVKLIVNSHYAEKNNLHSLYLAKEEIGNTYILPSDIYCLRNPFRRREGYSWYMVREDTDRQSGVRVNRKNELVNIRKEMEGNVMIGIAYITEDIREQFLSNLDEMVKDRRFENSFWESAIVEKDRMLPAARIVSPDDVIEINTYEQLRDLDSNSGHLQNGAMEIIENCFHVENRDITELRIMKKGMTNRSFLFSVRGKRYIIRIPGEGTDKLIDRKAEALAYQRIANRGIGDQVVFIDPQEGYKITEYWENAKNCDADNRDEVSVCMQFLRKFHEMKLKGDEEFKLFEKVLFYESLWEEMSIFPDYEEIKRNVFSLKPFLDSVAGEKILCHIDSVPDNFLFIKGKNGKREVKLIDWEYSAMQDPHVDIAMFAIYSLYDRKQTDFLISSYFPEGCDDMVRIKIYAYMAVAGLVWSNWCEYKRGMGVEFGEYSLRQYRYAKEFYRLVKQELKKRGKTLEEYESV